MHVYAIMRKSALPELRSAIEREFPDQHFRFSDNVFFVRSADLPRAIIRRLDVKWRDGDGNLQGVIDSTVVMQLGSTYSGWATNEVWPWLRHAFEGTA